MLSELKMVEDGMWDEKVKPCCVQVKTPQKRRTNGRQRAVRLRDGTCY